MVKPDWIVVVKIRPTTRATTDQTGLEMAACRISGRPGPLKIEAAEVAGDVDDFADEIEPGDGSGFECFRGKF